MANIQEIKYPNNIGIANKINVSISSNTEEDGGQLSYYLSDESSEKVVILSQGFFNISNDLLVEYISDKNKAIQHVISEIGVTLI